MLFLIRISWNLFKSCVRNYLEVLVQYRKMKKMLRSMNNLKSLFKQRSPSDLTGEDVATATGGAASASVSSSAIHQQQQQRPQSPRPLTPVSGVVDFQADCSTTTTTTNATSPQCPPTPTVKVSFMDIIFSFHKNK